ncbi:hypothetical protein [Acidovorax lacteus]|uniref:Uncharacterized protein n=1 Tax=Acidovorax lacteus TaxID=1924988 RepID=A0ABP8LAE7_9BURK
MNDVVERGRAVKPAKKPAVAKKPRAVQVLQYDTTPSYSLASKAGRAAVAKMVAEFDANPAKEAAFWRSAGILTRTGRLTKRYGG